jgi:RHS repeat-associated protein
MPKTAQITSSKIKLYFYGINGSATSTTINCHRVLKSWDKTAVTWVKRTSSANWTTAGLGLDSTDASATVYGSATMTTDYGWKDFVLSPILVQNWVAATWANYGVVLWATNEASAGADKYFRSSEYSDATYRPRLEITYKIDPLVTYFYDEFGRKTTSKYASGVAETNTYDSNRGWLTARTYNDGTYDIFKIEHPIATIDQAGNITQQRMTRYPDAAKTYDFTVDSLYRISSFKENGTLVQSYRYDDNGNLTTFTGTGKTMTYGGPNNRLTGDGSRTFVFDEIGRVKQIGSTNLTYDIFSNMITYGSNTYIYDAFDQRIRKTENGAKTYYITSGMDVLEEYGTDDTTPTAIYIYGLDGMIAKIDPDTGYYWIYKDQLGSLRLASGVSGNSTMKRDYYPFGVDKTAAGDQVAYKFTGKELDNGIGLYYFGARYYDPSIGRWIVPDPAGQGFSPYAYCGNRPLYYVDKDGNFFWIPILIGAAIGGGGNLAYQALSGNIHSFGDGLAAFGIGALAGGASVLGCQAIGAIGGVSLMTETGAIGSGALPGMVAGGIGGGISTFGNSLYFGHNSLGKAALNGLGGMFGGALSGGAIGGALSALSGQSFWGQSIEMPLPPIPEMQNFDSSLPRAAGGRFILNQSAIGNTWDPTTNYNIAQLDLNVAKTTTDYINFMDDMGIKLRIFSSYRSIEEQNKLFLAGTSPLRGGESMHNFRRAIDVVQILGKKALWENQNWFRIGSVGWNFGFEWGGMFTKIDRVHLQMPF